MKEECFTHHPNQAEDLTTAYCPAVGIMEILEERTKISLPSILENRSWQNQMETKFLTVFHEKHHTKDRLEAIRASKRDHEETTQNDPIRQQSAGPKTYQIRMINGSPGSC